MKLVSWNVNGLRAVVNKNFSDIFKQLDADIFCLQEIKLSEGQLDLNFDGYESFWNYAQKKGYSGTAVYSRSKSLGHSNGINHPDHDSEGRVITIEYDDFYLVNVYTPNSRSELTRLDYRMEWENRFLEYVTSLDKNKPVVICGDLNVAHNDIDLKNPKNNHNNPGFTDSERNAFTRLLKAGFIDSYRHLHPETQKFSWWSYRYGARAKNIGWRIDYFLVSERLADRLSDADILDTISGSDHCPVFITLNINSPI